MGRNQGSPPEWGGRPRLRRTPGPAPRSPRLAARGTGKECLILKLIGIALAAAIGPAQAQTRAPALRPEFEVASIKPNNGVDERPGMQVSYGGHLTIHAMTVRILIGAAYNIDESFLSFECGSPCYSPCWRIPRSQGRESRLPVSATTCAIH